MSDLEDNGVQLRVFLWCKPEDYFRVKEPCIENIKYAWDKHGIEIPFPQRVLHVEKENSETAFVRDLTCVFA